MTQKAVIRSILLAFIVVCLGYVGLQELRGRTQLAGKGLEAGAVQTASVAAPVPAPAVAEPAGGSSSGADAARPSGQPAREGEVAAVAPLASLPRAGAPSAVAPASGPEKQLVVYYFHGNARCKSCLKIEAYTQEALQSLFTDQLKTGRVKWTVINTDEPENKHYVDDYKLYTKSVVLADMVQGKEVRWRNMEEVWNYLDDQERFKGYIRDGVKAYLGGA